jgi:hypothetical protein
MMTPIVLFFPAVKGTPIGATESAGNVSHLRLKSNRIYSWRLDRSVGMTNRLVRLQKSFIL